MVLVRACCRMIFQALRKKIPLPPSALRNQQQSDVASGVPDAENLAMTGPEFVNMDEIYKCRLAALKREEEALRVEEERVNAEKQRYIRLMKRVRDEDCSRFSTLQAPLVKRYALLGMLGKGGFSEVFKVRPGNRQ